MPWPCYIFSGYRCHGAPLGLQKSHGKGTNIQTHRQTDFTTTRPNRPSGENSRDTFRVIILFIFFGGKEDFCFVTFFFMRVFLFPEEQTRAVYRGQCFSTKSWTFSQTSLGPGRFTVLKCVCVCLSVCPLPIYFF